MFAFNCLSITTIIKPNCKVIHLFVTNFASTEKPIDMVCASSGIKLRPIFGDSRHGIIILSKSLHSVSVEFASCASRDSAYVRYGVHTAAIYAPYARSEMNVGLLKDFGSNVQTFGMWSDYQVVMTFRFFSA